MDIEIRTLLPTDTHFIDLLSSWYWNEWQIPAHVTTSRLSTQAKDDILFQLILIQGGVPAATGGLYHRVGLPEVHPSFKCMGPWVAQIYTHPDFRNRGLADMLLKSIESMGAELGFSQLYLYTNTAESLYARNGWRTFEKVTYRNRETVVMKKSIREPEEPSA